MGQIGMSSTSTRGNIGTILAIRDYRIFWTGNFLSRCGVWVQRLAIAWLTWQLTQSPAWLGLIGFLSLFPFAALTPFSGAVADRFGIRRTAIVANSVSAMNAFLFATLTYSGVLTIELIVVLTLVHSISGSFSAPAFNSLIPDMVPVEVRSSAVAFNATAGHASTFIGAGIFGLVINLLDVSGTFVVNGATFLYFAYCLKLLNLPSVQKSTAPLHHLFQEMTEGIRMTVSNRALMSLYFTQIALHLLVAPHRDLLAGFAEDVFARGVDGLSILAGASGIGAVAGGVAMSMRGKMSGLITILNLSILLALVVILIFATTGIFWLAVGCTFFVGMAFVVNGTCMQTLLLNSTNRSNRGRIMALSIVLPAGLPALGALALGFLSDVYGLQVPLASASVLGLVIWVFGLRDVRRHASTLETPVEN
jgi:MFS family permease